MSELKDELSTRDILQQLVGRCESLQLDAKTRNTPKSASHMFNYGQEEAFKQMAENVKEQIKKLD